MRNGTHYVFFSKSLMIFSSREVMAMGTKITQTRRKMDIPIQIKLASTLPLKNGHIQGLLLL
jgi:hypothetical protein